MTERSDQLTDAAIAAFLRSRSADPDLSLLDDIVRAVETTPQSRPWLGLPSIFLPRRALLIVVSALLLATMGAIGIGSRFVQPDPLVVTFGGTWISTSDADGGTQTMRVGVSADAAVDITVYDTIASVCSGTPSTMTGAGAIEDGARLVIAAPVYACDDGSQPQSLSGPSLEEQLRNLTLVFDPQTGALTDNFGGVWHREGVAIPSPESSSGPTASSQMWPQSSLDEVRMAQELADAGHPDYTWQVDPQLAGDDYGKWERLYDGDVELVDRFLREVLGWDAYMQNPLVGGADYSLTDQRFLRCAPGRTNPLYPPQPGSEDAGESCAPTIDELTYESVSLDLVQPDRQGPGGIWVVSNWRPTTFAQSDPAVTEAQATERLEEFLAARIAGRGAEGYVDVYAGWLEPQVPLLYTTTSGAPYERFEFERVDGPQWPYGGYITFSVRLFADDGGSVVEQEIYSHWDGGRSAGIEGGLALGGTTTENGQPVPMTFEMFDGEITYSSPSQNSMGVGDDGLIDFTDPAVFWSECAQSPVPGDAAAFVQVVIADPNFETTAPVAARVGGVEGVSVDVALAPGGRTCLAYRTDANRWIHALEPGKRVRLYLVDLPEGMSMQTLAITVMAPEARFEEVIEEAKPIIDSIEFHPG